VKTWLTGAAFAALLVLAATTLACGGGSGSAALASPAGPSIDQTRGTTAAFPRAAKRAKPDPLEGVDRAEAARLTATALTLAGLPAAPESDLARVQDAPAWASHARALDAGWASLEREHLAPIRAWSRSELSSHASRAVFYPFSGPDFLFAYTFFPEAGDYLLVGLEPVGGVPELVALPEEETARRLKWVQQTLGDMLQISFFRTNDMKSGLADEGVLPILLVFLARTGNQVLRVEPVGLDGQPEAAVAAGSRPPRGVRVTFLPEGAESPRRLYYFSVDLSDWSLQGKRDFTRFIKTFDEPATYLKAASYLMYREKYTRVRSLILSRSSVLLQDDSGIPLADFDGGRWDLKFYGTYTRPIPLFADRYQPALKAAYEDGGAGPLEFGIGYKHRSGEANLMLALARPPSVPAAPDPPGARDLLNSGRYGEAAQVFREALPSNRDAYSICIAVSCLPSSIAGILQCSQGDSRLLLLPGRLKGEPCYQALWGVYPTRADAVAALDEVPDTFALDDAPAVIRLERPRSPA
jgi:hypothetical protein